MEATMEVRTDTAAALIESASFFYSADAWVKQYIAARADSGFKLSSSANALILPWLMRLYVTDASVAVLVSNFIENDLLTPLSKPFLHVAYARSLAAIKSDNLALIYLDYFKQDQDEVAYRLLFAYNFMDALIRKTALASIIPEVILVAKQLSFALEIVVSSLTDKKPFFDNINKVVDIEYVKTIDPFIIRLIGMLKAANNKFCSECYRKAFSAYLSPSADKTIELAKKNWKALSIQSDNIYFHETFGALAKVCKVSMV